MNLNSCIEYLKYILKHKWYVFIECWKRGLYWRGFIHDFSKFLPSEFNSYREYFYTDKQAHEANEAFSLFGIAEAAPYGFYVKDRFNISWLKHIHRNRHHWQHWVLREDDGNVFPLPMPDKYKIEMLCDWIGAGKAITGKDNCFEWYSKSKDNMLIHPETRDWIEKELGV